VCKKGSGQQQLKITRREALQGRLACGRFGGREGLVERVFSAAKTFNSI